MKFLLDDNIPYSLKKWFQEKRIDAIKLSEIGLKGAEDEVIYRQRLKTTLQL